LDSCPVLSNIPLICEHSSAPDLRISTKEVGIWHPENTIITEFIFEGLQSFWGPFFGSVTPGSVPFGFAPRVLHLAEAISIIVNRAQEGVCMIVFNSLTSNFTGVRMSILSSPRIEQELFVDFQEAFIP